MSSPARPRVSVIVPGKDAENYIADTLTSLTRQMPDPHDLEVIVVNDGSKDATGDIAESYASRLPNLKVLTNAKPSGLANARNQGLAESTGRYVVYLDSDDWLAPRRLEVLADAMEAFRVDFVRSDHTTVDGRKRNIARAPQARRGVVLNPRDSILPATDSTMVDYPYAWAGMFDRAIEQDGLLTFPKGLHTAEDRPWIWQLFLKSRSYAVVDAPTLCYRRSVSGSLTSTYDRRQLDIIPALRTTLDLILADKEAERFLPKLTRTTFALVAHHMSRSRKMTPDVRRDLKAGARDLFAAIPPNVLAHEVRYLKRERERLLHGLLPHLSKDVSFEPAEEATR
ncbi:glycosyltransferase family 2 protein [Promicromonospora sp. NPDC050249]|uniref:glycosyltransferase family 2 protein n=1 Tax=Promicromonospora sp. NPDC050249 TaxID=3154743 RepID=UPI0033CE9F09